MLLALTVIVAGALGGAIAANLTAIVVIAAIVLAIFALLNGLRTLSGIWSELSPD